MTRLRLGLLAAMLTWTAVLVPTRAAAEESPPDNTPPWVLSFAEDQCPAAPHPCQIYQYELWAFWVDEDLAVVGARLGDTVLDEFVYNDGSGPRPFGEFCPYGNDVCLGPDVVVRFRVPDGTHDVTFYARDLSGNESTMTSTITSAGLPDPVEEVWASRIGKRRSAYVQWLNPYGRGAVIESYEVRLDDRPMRTVRAHGVPSSSTATRFKAVAHGWHELWVRPHNAIGWGEASVHRFRVPRRTVHLRPLPNGGARV
ncbi:MAG TPA: fibronectin type III domain-containing protein [Nocardioides sp.]|nr:fibronectin type III domain-containing protein [Nocardioides sp.]